MRKNHVLSFTRKERSGVTALMIILLLVIIVPRVVQSRSERIESRELKETTSPLAVASDSSGEFFPVDRDNYTRLSSKTDKVGYHRYDQSRKSARSKPGRYTFEPIDINTADTSAFIALPGIGSKLAARIVLFRERLGGFFEVAQVSEVYGLRDSTYQLIKPMLRCNAGLVRKIEINSASKDQLRSHPYIRWQIADAIVNYRAAHGSIQSSHDLSGMHLLDSVTVAKVIPYLVFN